MRRFRDRFGPSGIRHVADASISGRICLLPHERKWIACEFDVTRQALKPSPAGVAGRHHATGGYFLSVIFEPEAHLHADLKMRDLATLKLAANLRDLKPVHVP